MNQRKYNIKKKGLFRRVLVSGVMTYTILGLMGLPGAGKTSGLESIVDRVDHTFVGLTMSDIAGTVYDRVETNTANEYFEDTFINSAKKCDVWEDIIIQPEDEKVEVIGDWVDSILQVNGDFFALKTVEYIENKYSEGSIIVIDGIRTTADVNVLKDNFNVELVYIHTPFNVRLERLQDRGRGSEESMDPDELMYRDKQELSWGVDEILSTEEVRYMYNNYSSIEKYHYELDLVVNDVLDL